MMVISQTNELYHLGDDVVTRIAATISEEGGGVVTMDYDLPLAIGNKPCMKTVTIARTKTLLESQSIHHDLIAQVKAGSNVLEVPRAVRRETLEVRR